MKIDEQISREIGVHGNQWDSMHEGYFADSVIARPLIKTITQYLSGSNTDIIVDLRGGTGYILLELIAKGLTVNMILVNLDCSATQPDAMEKRERCPAPPLKLSSVELGQRYGLDSQTLTKISGRMMEEFGEIENVFQQGPDGFVAHLHYRICVTKAA